MHRFLLPLTVLSALLVVGCSKNEDLAPAVTAPTVVASITPTATVLQLAQMQTYTLSATNAPTTVTWVSSNTSVLMIAEGGVATAVGIGAATITATGDAGQSATLTVQVVPIYTGNWTGVAKVIACTDIAGFAANAYCTQSLGATQKVTLSFSQNGVLVSGTMTKQEGANSVNGSMTGTIGVAGDVTMTGTLAGVANGSNLQVVLISWNSLAAGTVMTGSWSANVTSPQILGLATLQWTLNLQTAP